MRKSQSSDEQKNLHIWRRLTFQHQLPYTISTWVEWTWVTRWGHTTHQVVQVKSGGGTYSGSCWMSQSATRLSWNASPCMPHLPEVGGHCSTSSLSWPSEWLEGSVAGSDILEGRGNMHPMTMQWHCLICQAANKCSSRDGKEPVSNAPTMDKRHHLGIPLRQQQLVPDGSDSELPRAFSNTLLRPYPHKTLPVPHHYMFGSHGYWWKCGPWIHAHTSQRVQSAVTICMIVQSWWLQLLNNRIIGNNGTHLVQLRNCQVNHRGLRSW